jgi:26S proteasome regulatory subunit N10
MEGLTEEQEMQRAIQMSMSDNNSSATTNNPAGGDFDEAMQDPDFMSSVLGSLSGVDTNDPRIQNVLQGFSSSANSAEEDAKKKEEEDAKKKDESK